MVFQIGPFRKLEILTLKKRKGLSMTGNFHIYSDVDFLYIPRSEGGRGLKAIQTAYKCGIVSLNHHLTRNKERNQLLQIVCLSEENESGRVANELCFTYDITKSQNELPRSAGQKYLKSKYKQNMVFYQNKVMHGYIAKSIEMAQWLRHWIPNPGVPCSKPLSVSKFNSAFHPSKVNKVSTRNFWGLSGKK